MMWIHARPVKHILSTDALRIILLSEHRKVLGSQCKASAYHTTSQPASQVASSSCLFPDGPSC